MLGQRINELRISFGWNQVQLAKRLNISKQTISNWENENIQPSIEMLVRLSQTFGVTTDYLLGLDDVPRINVSGLSRGAVAHLAMIIEDIRSGNKIEY